MPVTPPQPLSAAGGRWQVCHSETLDMTTITTGLSGIALYLPPYRVDLQRWCEWTGADWDKIRQVVGSGFRLLGPVKVFTRWPPTRYSD